MKWLNSFIKLDYYTIKPYITLKNIIIYLGLGFILGYSMKSPIAATSVLIFSVNTYSTYLFAVGEQNGIDVLYSVLPIKRSQVVFGRYVFIFILTGIMWVVSLGIALLIRLLLSSNMSMEEIIISLVAVAMIQLLMVIIQLPVYFKSGYLKGKNIAFISYIALAVMVGFSLSIAEKIRMIQLTRNGTIVVIILAVVCFLGGVILSYQASKKLYLKRDF